MTLQKFQGKEEKINGEWYPVTIRAESAKDASKMLWVGQIKSYGTVEKIRGRFYKVDD